MHRGTMTWKIKQMTLITRGGRSGKKSGDSGYLRRASG